MLPYSLTCELARMGFFQTWENGNTVAPAEHRSASRFEHAQCHKMGGEWVGVGIKNIVDLKQSFHLKSTAVLLGRGCRTWRLVLCVRKRHPSDKW